MIFSFITLLNSLLWGIHLKDCWDYRVFNIIRHASCFPKWLHEFILCQQSVTLHHSISFGIMNSVSRFLAAGILCGQGEDIFLQVVQLLVTQRIFLAWILSSCLFLGFELCVRVCMSSNPEAMVGWAHSQSSFLFQSTDQVERSSLWSPWPVGGCLVCPYTEGVGL